MMRFLFILVLLALAAFPATAQPKPPAMPVAVVKAETLDDASPPAGPVVAELFTMKGCAFCPQAEQIFAALTAEPGVIGIACHVDYLKGSDPLAQAFCTERQGWYMNRLRSGPGYTPQLIVNGVHELVGYKTDKVMALVRQGRGEGMEAIIIQPVSGNAYRIAVPDRYAKAGLRGWNLTVMTFRKTVQDQDQQYAQVADDMQILPLDAYHGPAFNLTVPLSAEQQGFVVFLQKQDSGRVAAAGQFIREDEPAVR